MDNNYERGDAARGSHREKRLWRILSGGLDEACERMGGELTGVSCKTVKGDCLITLRLLYPSGRFVAFVGGYSLAECFLKAFREASADRLRLKPDQYSR